MEEMIERNAIDFIFFTFRLEGWLPDPNWSSMGKIAHRCYGMLAYALVTVSAVAQVNTIQIQFSNEEYGTAFTSLAEVLGIFYSMFVTLLFSVYAKKLREVNVAVKETARFAFKYSPEISAKKYRQSWSHSNLVIKCVLFAFESSVFLWSILPLYDYFQSTSDSTNKRIRFAFPKLHYGLAPVEDFWKILFLQFGYGIYATVGLALGFVFPLVISTLVQGQISILTDSLLMAQNSKTGSGQVLPESKNESRIAGMNIQGISKFNSSDGVEGPHKNSINLKDCILHHQQILRLLKKTKSLLMPFLFFCVMYINIILANVAVASALMEGNSSMILTGSQAILFSLQLIVEALYITKLRIACSEVGYAAYSVYLKNQKSWRELLLIIFRSNQEEKFSCFLTSSFTFRSVFKTLELVWNYFIIVNKMVDNLSS